MRRRPAEQPRVPEPSNIVIMGYLRKRMSQRRRGLSGLGDLASTLESVLGTGVNIAQDPYLNEVLCHITQLQQIKAGGEAGACAQTPDGLQGGIGLSRAVKPMRAYVWLEGHKWGYAVAAAAIIGIPMWLGYELGKKG